MDSMKLLIINGPNINLLGVREVEIYGKRDYRQLVCYIEQQAKRLGIEAEVFQSNREGEIIDAIQGAMGRIDGIVINAAAYTHTSIAILDALKAVALPAAEVHLTDVGAREPFRQISYVGMACSWHFAGMGFDGYGKAMEALKEYLIKSGRCIL